MEGSTYLYPVVDMAHQPMVIETLCINFWKENRGFLFYIIQGKRMGDQRVS